LVITRTNAQGAFPVGFSEVRIADQLDSPTAMAVAPDGRIFVAHQGGAIRIIKNDALLPTPFYTVPTAAYDEQGLSGLTFDPDFASNGYVYVTYSPADPGANKTHQRVSRITANGDVGSNEVTLFELPQSRIEYHLAGALQFGADGKLYVTVGEGVGNDAQNENDFAGKVLRLNKDGSVPNDNPYCTNPQQKRCAIWAKGLRNPFVMNVQPGSDRIFVNDVGGSAWEEINELQAGKNYGFPLSEGASVGAGQTAPVYAYAHGEGCAVVGGAFYGAAQFPAAYLGKYFFADYCSGWLRFLNPDAPTSAQNFGAADFGAADFGAADFGAATGIGIVSLAVGLDGSLYYLARGSTRLDGGSGEEFATGSVFKVSYSGSSAPYLITQPQNQTLPVGQKATFSAEAGGGQPLFYQWQKDGSDIAEAKSASYTTPNLTLSDSGAQYRVVITNASGRITSTAAALTVLDNQPPTATITQPSVGSTYASGQVLAFAGAGSDPETTLQPGAFTWKIDLHHDTHTHPFMQPTSGITSGTIALPSVPHATEGVFYRIYLTVSDGQLATTVTRDVYPVVKKLIVDWGGDYVSADTAMQRFITLDTNVDLDGDGANDDTRGYLPWSDTQPISPNPIGGNHYGNSYAQNTSWRFYGGVLLQRYNGNFGSKWAEIWERPNGLDRIYYSADAVSDGWMALAWQKTDFLEGGDAGAVSFDASSSLEVLNYAGADGDANNNYGRLHFVVKNGDQFYISNDYAEKNASSFMLSDPASREWAVYNPSAPYSIKVDVGSASFAVRTFDDVTAVGVYHASEDRTSGARRAGLNFERFRVYANVGPEPPPVVPASTVTPQITPTASPNLRPRLYMPVVLKS
jgi:glucose/arabinose dehydrogenase